MLPLLPVAVFVIPSMRESEPELALHGAVAGDGEACDCMTATHVTATHSTHGHMIGRVCHSATRESPEERIPSPLAPYQGRGRYPAHEKGRVCLPLAA